MKSFASLSKLGIICLLVVVAGCTKKPQGRLERFEQNGKWGLRDTLGTIFVSVDYDFIVGYELGSDTIAWLLNRGGQKAEISFKGPGFQGGKWGLSNEFGKIVLECKYDEIRPAWPFLELTAYTAHLYWIRDGGHWVQPFYSGESEYCDSCSWGLVNNLGQMLVKPTFRKYVQFSEGSAWVLADTSRSGKRFGGLWGLIDSSGNMVIPAVYTEAKNFEKGLAEVRTREGWGVIDRFGRILIRPQFREIRRASSGWSSNDKPALFWFATHRGLDRGTWGLVDTTGSILTKLKYDDVRTFTDSVVWVAIRVETSSEETQEKWGLLGRSGQIIMSPQFDNVMDFHKGVAWVNMGEKYYGGRILENGKWGLVNSKGLLIVQPRFDNVSDFYNGFARVQINNKWGFINEIGTLIVQPKFDACDNFYDGIARVNIGGHEGLNDQTQGGKWGLIDTTGVFVIKAEFEDINKFSKSTWAKKNEKWGLLDSSGHFIKEPSFTEYAHFILNGRKFFWVNTGIVKRSFQGNKTGKWGLISLSGGVVIEPKFDKISLNDSTVWIGDKKGLVNRDGEFKWADK